MPREYTYGPFQSRRLKLSLGVDVLSKIKICTYNCAYCELGITNKDQLVSPEYRISIKPTINFQKELHSILKYVPHLNSITFGYNGEPTLNLDLLDFLKIAIKVRDRLKWTESKPKLTLFTNSSKLYLDEVRERVKQFELVLAKLDVATEEDFKRTNCPHKDTPNLKTIIDSIIKLRKEMPIDHKLAIQCLIYNSYRKEFVSNNNPENIEKLAYMIKKIKPDFVQVYSIARIPAQNFVYAIDEDRKKEIAEKFKEIINNEDIKINYY